MSFHNVRFPVEIGLGSVVGPGYKTEVTALDSGAEGRVSFWSSPRHKCDVSYGVRSMEDLAEVKKFFLARQGALNSFRFKDWTDFTTNSANPTHTSTAGERDQGTSPIAGNGSLQFFQLVKRYVSGGITTVRHITLPVDSTISVWVNGTKKDEGVDFDVDYQTGVVYFYTAPPNGHLVEWSGEFDIKMRFDDSADEFLGARIDGYDMGNIPNIPLIEVIDQDAPNTNEFFYGGAIEKTILASITVDNSSFLWTVVASTAGLSVRLPDPAVYPIGGPHWIIQNVGATNSFDVKNNSGTTLVTLTANKSCIIVLTVESDLLTRTWYALGN